MYYKVKDIEVIKEAPVVVVPTYNKPVNERSNSRV